MKQQLLDPAACVGKTISGIALDGPCAVIAFTDFTCLPLHAYSLEDYDERIGVRALDPLYSNAANVLMESGAISEEELSALIRKQDAETTERVEQCERAEYARLKAKYG